MSDTPTPIPVPTEAGNADRTGRLSLSEHGVVRGSGQPGALFRTGVGDASFTGRIHAAIVSARLGVAQAVSDNASGIRDKAPDLAGQAGSAAARTPLPGQPRT